MIEADTPTLWEIRLAEGHATAVAILVQALIHTARLVNTDRNLTETQIGELSNDILNDFGFLKVEEVKAICKKSIRCQNVYSRLDYNVVMNWFESYVGERLEICRQISEQRDSEERHSWETSEDSVTFEQWLKMLEEDSAAGDSHSADLLADVKAMAEKAGDYKTAEQQHAERLQFRTELLRQVVGKMKSKKR